MEASFPFFSERGMTETYGWNRCGCEAAIAREKDCGKHEDGVSTDAEGAERLEEKWQQRKE
jgi:hypothetical protein